MESSEFNNIDGKNSITRFENLAPAYIVAEKLKWDKKFTSKVVEKTGM